MVAVYGQTDKIMLKHMINETEIGYYSTAVAICTVWCFVLSAIIDSLNPPIMQAHKENKEKFKQLNKLLYCIIFYVSLCVSIILIFFGDVAIKLLYGEAYLPASAPLKIVTWYTAFSYWGVARNAWIVCENKQKYLKYIYISAAIANVILNIIFIPPLGAVGTAIASLVAQIVTTIIVPFFIKDMRENSVMMLESVIFKGIRSRK
jgi:O-antigen/teichoic acid export membrane protein